jgi:hypothetical protein
MPSGYLHQDYAASLAEFGRPLALPASGAWILTRQIPGTALVDGMGCYPLFCCAEWRKLPQDVRSLDERLVSVVVVADPLGDHTPDLLADAFDRVVAYKEHFVIETGRPLEQFVSKSHRAHAQRALKEVHVELCPTPLAFIDDWERLYGVLATRHSITGLRRFSRMAFERQLAIPGMVMFRAVAGGHTIGLDLWYEQGHAAQGHLAAFDSTGYRLRASYATKWRAIEYFTDKVRWMNLGAVPTATGESGLLHFKHGWSTGTKRAWLCGRVLNPVAYEELVEARRAINEPYFPAYRAGEFAD